MAIADARSPNTLDRAGLLDMYERMVQIRTFEDTASKKFADGKMPGFVHLYAGEEAVAVGVCAHLTDKDYITSTHRGHGHCIAKGVDIEAMVAELMGKATGSCKGKGGSMHIADVDKGMLGANGIVGGGLPLACGAALTAKTLGTGGVAVCFFGDGAANQGTFHESLNLAAIWKLPAVFSKAAPETIENRGFNALKAELEAFAAAIEGGPAYPIPPDQILHGVAAFEAIIRSAAERRPVKVAR